MEIYLTIAIGAIFVNNFILARFLGLCPFIGVSKKTSAALGMGMAVTFVMTMASAATFLLYDLVLRPDAWVLRTWAPALADEGLVDVLKTVTYILVIATLVQLVEMVIRKVSRPLYDALGIYLPLITTNCAVLGVTLLNTTDAPERLALPQAIVQGVAVGVGFTIAMLLMSGIRERLDLARVPAAMRGVPIAFICTGMMALAYLGFSGMV